MRDSEAALRVGASPVRSGPRPSAARSLARGASPCPHPPPHPAPLPRETRHLRHPRPTLPPPLLSPSWSCDQRWPSWRVERLRASCAWEWARVWAPPPPLLPPGALWLSPPPSPAASFHKSPGAQPVPAFQAGPAPAAAVPKHKASPPSPPTSAVSPGEGWRVEEEGRRRGRWLPTFRQKPPVARLWVSQLTPSPCVGPHLPGAGRLPSRWERSDIGKEQINRPSWPPAALSRRAPEPPSRSSSSRPAS